MTRDKWASREIQHRMEDGIIVSCSDGRGARGKARKALRGQAGERRPMPMLRRLQLQGGISSSDS
jgi:hypothetical protein